MALCQCEIPLCDLLRPQKPTMMRFLKALMKVGPRQLIRLFSLVLRHPFMVWPTVKATYTCLRAADHYFGKEHHRNTPANAFRHAYWNYLIAHNCHSLQNDLKKVLSWTKTITDWHEDAFENQNLAKQMDLHNNAVGRDIFCNLPATDTENALDHLLELTSHSKKVETVDEILQRPLSLVHLIDIA